MPTYWQIAAGSGAYGRNYSDLFLRYGIAFVGGESQIAAMKEVKKGDKVALKNGLSQIAAAGDVVERGGKASDVGDKDWIRDVDGWDLQAYCYVDWRVPASPTVTRGLTRSTIQRIQQDEHKRLVDDILALPVQQFESEPPATHDVDNRLLEFMVEKGLRPSAADELTHTLRRIRLLAQYYYDKYENSSELREHEIRSFLVIPLLLALGWSEQQMKIELPCSKGRVDIACFSGPYLDNRESCVLIVETKDYGSGLYYAPEQARQYANDFKACQVVLVSNGYCYKAYVRQGDGSFDISPSAYLNLLRPRDRYPLDPSKGGALDVLGWLLPNAFWADARKAPCSGASREAKSMTTSPT